MSVWKHKVSAAACSLALLLTLIPAAAAADAGPVKSSNKNSQDYSGWADTVKSYLYENEKGGLTRVEYVGGQVVIEDYDSGFHYLSGRTIAPELPIWGGFFAGEDYNFLVFGRENRGEDNSREVIRVVKYDKDWNCLGQASLRGANTTVPFDAGSLRMDEYNGYLFIRTCHEMYATKDDGINHQSNLTLAVRQSDMSITDSCYDIMNISCGYISHSFNQFILVDQSGKLVALDHGDAYPRSVALTKYSASVSGGKFTGSPYSAWCSSIDLLEFAGAIGANTTGGSVGGLAETTDCYIAAYNYDQAGGRGDRYPYLHWVNKSGGTNQSVRLSDTGSATPVLVPTGLNGGYMLWNGKTGGRVSDTLCYLRYGADGRPGEVRTASGSLSDCQPICRNGKVVWYVTSDSVPTFYQLDASGLTATPAGQGAPVQPAGPAAGESGIPASGVAYASTQTVTVDGKAVEFRMYALKDAGGNLTNYIKLRDMAYVLNGTQAQFSVGYDGTISLTTGRRYTAGGTEMTTPFSGNRNYTGGTQSVKVDGKAVAMTAITLTDDAGGGYNYFKLRDLGKTLGFSVGYSNETGIFIDSGKPYSE